MRIAVIGGGPGGLYFSALAQQLATIAGESHEITVWERNAADDTFGFGVVFSDETLGGIEHADPEVFAQMQREFAVWDDIDVHFKGEVVTSGGHAFAAMSRRRLLEILQARCRQLGVTIHFSTEAPDVRELAAEPRPGGRRRRAQLGGASDVRRHVRADARAARLQVHLARHRQGLRRLQVLHRADARRRHADPRLSLQCLRQHLHRRDDLRGVGAGRLRGLRGSLLCSGGVRRTVHRNDPGAVRRRARRARGSRQQLALDQLHHRPQ